MIICLGFGTLRKALAFRDRFPTRDDHRPKVRSHEANLSAQQTPAQQEPRLFDEDVHQSRSTSDQSEARQGPEAFGGVAGIASRGNRGRATSKGYRLLSRTTFTKAERIRKRTEFRRLSKDGRRFHAPFFLAVVGPAPTPSHRLGITVSKKVGKSVRRNRIKRLAREYFRHHAAELRGPLDIHMIAKSGAAELSSKEIFAQFQNLFHRLSRRVDH
jgi:ribonuclease P protein component